jgi:hypothetical protein
MFLMASAVAALFALQPIQAQSVNDGSDDPRARIAQDTILIAVTNYTGAASAFVEDTDPNTLQIVFLQKEDQGDSHVSADGEVVFLSPGASESIQQELIQAAYNLRYQRRVSDQN